MWEMKNGDKFPRQFNAIHANNTPCRLCGQHFRKGEQFYIIIVPNEYKLLDKKLKANFFVHVNEWDEFCNGVSTDKELVKKIQNLHMKRTKKMTEEESKRLDAFKKACKSFGFYKEVPKTYGARMRKRGTSIYVDYNVFSDKISVDHRCQKGLFDSLYTREIVAKIYSEMHNILGDGKTDNYNPAETIKKISEDVKKTMKEIF